MNFERGLDPKESMGIGVDALLKELKIKFAHTQLGEPVFVKEEGQEEMILRPLDWDSKQLRVIADYLDAHPESTKVIDIVDDHTSKWILNPPAPAPSAPDIDLDTLDLPMRKLWVNPPPMPPSKFGNK